MNTNLLIKVLFLSLCLLTSLCLANDIKVDETAAEQDLQQAVHDKIFKHGWAMQLGTNAAGISYYTAHRAAAFGIETTPYIIRKEGHIESNGANVAVFARKNFHIVSHVVAGAGLSIGTEFGKERNKKISNAYEVGPYGILEFEITPYIIFGASLTLASYKHLKLNDETVTQWSFIKGGALQIAYIFSK